MLSASVAAVNFDLIQRTKLKLDLLIAQARLYVPPSAIHHS